MLCLPPLDGHKGNKNLWRISEMKGTAGKYWVLAIAAGLFLIFLGTATNPKALADEKEIIISGKILSIVYGPVTPFFARHAEMVIEDTKGKRYTVYVGHRTSYVPHRTPVAEDKVTVTCIKQDGRLAGVTVEYQ